MAEQHPAFDRLVAFVEAQPASAVGKAVSAEDPKIGNAEGLVIGEGDVPIAKNGAGDVYVWNAERGDVRFLDHESSFETSDEHASLDDFVEAVMESVVESAAVDQLEENDDAYAARLRFAIDVAGDELLDDDVRTALIERGLLEA